MKLSLHRIVEKGFLPTDDEALRLKKVALTLVPLIIGPAAFIWGTIYFLLGHPLSGSIPMSYSIISAFSLAYFFRTKNTRFIQFSQLLLVLTLPFLLMWSLGGFNAGSMVMIWAIFAPIAALMFLEKRVALLWFLAYSGLLLISGLIDGFLAEAVTPLPPLARNIFYLLNLGCGSAGLYLLVSYSIGEEKRAIVRLHDEQLSLEKFSDNLAMVNEKLNIEIAVREKAQEALNEAKERALELNRMLHAVLDTIPARIFWKDRKLNYLGCNRVFARDAGKSSPLEVEGATDYDMSWHEAAEMYRADDMRVMNSNQAKLNFEETQPLPDGSIKWLRTSKVPLRNAAGEVFGILGTYEDITEEKRTADKLVEAMESANNANMAKSAFLTSMSHELRTPLNAILGFAQLLEMDADTFRADQRDSIAHILTAGHQLLGLVNEVLDLSRIDTGKLEFNIQPLNIAHIVADCVRQSAAAIANKRSITFENLLTDSTLLVLADNLRLRQVLINLLSNAAKYNREFGRITIAGEIRENGRLRIEVRDTGQGIANDKLSLLFTPFERIDQKHGTISGVGIGLHISKQLIEGMHGTIGAHSVQGQGSTFWFELPLAEKYVESINSPEKEKQMTMQQAGSRFVVLYIEDNAVNIFLIEKALQSRPGIEMLTAETAEEGLIIAGRDRPDLILMDIQLPGMDGITATGILKNNEATRDIPVVALSADAMKNDVERALSAGCSAYLTKPVQFQKLYEVVDGIRLATENNASAQR